MIDEKSGWSKLNRNFENVTDYKKNFKITAFRFILRIVTD